MPCHGNGNLATDGCCYVAGQVCPLRWKVENGIVYEGPNLTDLGEYTSAVDTKIGGAKAKRDAAKAQVPGAKYLCRAALEVIAADPTIVNDRAGFEAAWNNHAEYVALVRPEWQKIEERNGLAPGSYQCSTWKGIGGIKQCCFAEPAINATTVLQTAFNATAVTIRSAAGH